MGDTGCVRVAGLGVPDPQSLGPLKEELPWEAGRGEAPSWASFSLPRTGEGAPACLPFDMLTKYPHCHPFTPGSRLNGPIQKLISTATSPFPSAPSTIMSSLSQSPLMLLEFDFPASPDLGTPPPWSQTFPARHLIAPQNV